MLWNTRILLLGCTIGLFQASAAVGLLTLPASAAPGSPEVVAALRPPAAHQPPGDSGG